ncbi:MAG: 1-deoxy-D-xylulose-5-phosphate synthase [Bacteroidales bacterium]|nr:1-deoxy-D-xylulose-5-phosphate synthase [Bacteroidales bacterium]
MYKILDKVNTPQDLRKLDLSELPGLCDEIRDYIVRCCAENPGHLASSLGAVELIVGMHYVYDTPSDKLVFDVGHQAYAHKIITGRKEAFKNNRKQDGISGFPNRDESQFDAFGAGHASTSVSAALGLAKAAQLSGTGEKVVAMIGDGAMTGGLALEGLNNAGDSDTDLLVILNDNEMAIDSNRGAIHSYLLKFTTDPAYNKLKTHVWERLGAGRLRNWLQRVVRNLKSGLVNRSGGDLFEAFGFRYFGPIDGNDIFKVIRTLRRLKDIKGPKILHTCTVKGKGYAPAEADPTTWHAPGKFDPETGERISGSPAISTGSGSDRVRYQDVFGEVLCELARKDPKVVGITPAMATGSGMTAFAEEFPDRFFDVGIAEEHAATFSAGLAAGGMKPYCSIYSTFAQRAYDEIVHDVALQHLPVVFCFDRAGLVGEDGATHQGVFDLAAMRSIPNTILAAPKDEKELKDMLYMGLEITDGPYIIRYPRGLGEGVSWKDEIPSRLEAGKSEKLMDGSSVAVLALGPVSHRTMEAASRIKEETGRNPIVYNVRFLKPFDFEMMEDVKDCGTIITLEDGALKGGLYDEVCEYVSSHGIKATVKGFGVHDRFMPQATVSQQRKACGLDVESIYSVLSKLFKNN